MKEVGQFPHRVTEIENAWIPLADGCRLAARIWMPAEAKDSPVPGILEYIPYRKRDGTADRDEVTHPCFAGHGYACVRVDIRGNGESEGLMWDEYLEQEQDDALEIIAWIAAQPWCSGAVGMIGISWGGFNGLQVAARRPPALKAIVTVCSTDDRYADDIHFKGGCLLNENLGWASTMFAYSSRPPDPALVGDSWRETWLERLNKQPLLVANWLKHPRRDAFWKHGSVCEDFSAIEAAVFAVGGWGDAYSNAIPRLLAGLKSPRRGLTGPWLHKYPHFAVPKPAIGFLQECLRWWDHWLKGEDSGIMAEPLYRAYLQESLPPKSYYAERPGRWIAEPAWPSPNIEAHRLFLTEGGLSERPEDEAALLCASPQTTGLSGGEFCALWLGPEAPGDQRIDDAGSLVFASAPLEERMEIFGAPRVELELAADRPLGFIVVRLCDLTPDGASSRITYGALNLAHRESHEQPAPLTAGERIRVTLQLDDIAHAFPAGNRIRLAVSTCYWPLFWPSPEAVTLTLFTGSAALALPVRPARDEALRPFEEAEGSPSRPRETLRERSNSRVVEQDQATGETFVRIFDDFGEVRDKTHGLAAGSIAREVFRILPNDPLSARAETHWTQTLNRDGWAVRTETYTTMTSDQDNFFITARLEAYEGEALVLERDWDEKIRREFL